MPGIIMPLTSLFTVNCVYIIVHKWVETPFIFLKVKVDAIIFGQDNMGVLTQVSKYEGLVRGSSLNSPTPIYMYTHTHP